MKAAILTTSIQSNLELEETLKRRGHQVRWIDPRKCYQYISEHEKGYDRFYYGTDEDEPERIHAGSLDCVIPRIGTNTDYASSILRFMIENLGIYCYNNPWGHIFASNKALSLQKLSAARIKVPRTIIAESPAHVKWAVEKLGIPIVIKGTHGSEGLMVAICDSKASANSMFEFCFNSGLKVILEEFIEAGGIDYRVWVCGDKVSAIMKRSAQNKGEFKANISRGGKGEKAELSEEDQQLCIRAAHAIGLQVAGVDLMKQEKTGTSYIVEVNGNPGTKIIQLTGVNPFEDIVELCENNYKRGNTDSPKGASATLINDLLISGNFWSSINELMLTNKILKDYFEQSAYELLDKIK